jgi:hypothetical protein
MVLVLNDRRQRRLSLTPIEEVEWIDEQSTYQITIPPCSMAAPSPSLRDRDASEHANAEGMSTATAKGTVSGRCLELPQIYRATDARQFLEEAGLSEDATIAQSDGRIMSAFVRARKPAATAKTCCGQTCCS